MRIILLLALLLILLTQSACGILFGNVKPVEEKSDRYGVLDLAAENPGVWHRLKADEEEPGADSDEESTESEIADVAFQSKKTASIISLNSACRPIYEKEEKSLRSFTDLLLLGISDITQREEKEIDVQATPALETKVQGKLNNELVKLKTVVLRRGTCIYDLMLVARPRHFKANEADFSRFINSLRLK